MKKILRSPITWFMVSICICLIILYCLGFKITYAPELENNWEAIAAIAAWASVITSTAAVIFAVWVPKKIAEEQNRISLFEKRYKFFNMFCRCMSFCDGLETVHSREQARYMFYVMLSEDQTRRSESEINDRITALQIVFVSNMDQGSYLFDFETESIMKPLIEGIVNFINAKEPKEFNSSREDLKLAGNYAKDQLFTKLEDAVRIGK